MSTDQFIGVMFAVGAVVFSIVIAMLWAEFVVPRRHMRERAGLQPVPRRSFVAWLLDTWVMRVVIGVLTGGAMLVAAVIGAFVVIAMFIWAPDGKKRGDE